MVIKCVCMVLAQSFPRIIVWNFKPHCIVPFAIRPLFTFWTFIRHFYDVWEFTHNGKVLSILLNIMCKLARSVLLLQVLAGHEGPISGLVFSSSQPLLVSGSWDKTVRLWNMFDSKVTWETLNVGSEGLLIRLLFILLIVIMLLCIQHCVETESDIN